MNQKTEAYWRKRFIDTARQQTDDHAIAIWSQEGFFAQQQVFFEVFRRVTSHPLQILDLGCGPGMHARRLAAEGHSVFGLDQSVPSLQKGKAKAEAEGHPVNWTCGDIYHLPYRSALFDCVICIGVIQTLFDETRTFHEITRVLKPGGLLVLVTRNALFRPNRRTDEEGGMRSYEPIALSRTIENLGYTTRRIDWIFILRKTPPPIRRVLRQFHHRTLATRPLGLFAEAFLLLSQKNP